MKEWLPKDLLASALAVLLVVLAFVLGLWVAMPPEEDGKNAGAAAEEASGGDSAETVWTCSMDPQVRVSQKGKCPICGMDLIPVEAGGGGAPRVALSKEAAALARLRTVRVERREVTKPVRLVGRVAFDETRLARITARFGGRIEEMFVDFVGTHVKKGDHLFRLYSPELLVAQEELIQAERALKRLPGGASAPLRESLEANRDAARDKLALWELRPWQIRQISRRKEPLKTVTIYSPIEGVVTARSAKPGSYVQTGTPVYTVADLTHVWVMLDAHESDLQWLRWGQRVTFGVHAYPGRQWQGEITFISPTLEPKTRTVRVRVNVDNADLTLKPDMFVRGVVDASLGGAAASSVEALRGKWVSPMHPEIVKDTEGKCDVCGMDLVPAEDHWMVGPMLAREKPGEAPIVIPVSAPLITGERAIVFVEQEGAEEPTYLLREIALGPRAGRWYVVVSGLMEGERVVAEGAFKLDSALQIRGDTSLMGLPPDPHEGHGHVEGDDAPAVKQWGIPKQAHTRKILRGPLRWLSEAEDPEAKAAAAADLAALAALEGLELPTGVDVSGAAKIATPEGFPARLDAAIAASLKVSAGLAKDDPAAAREAAPALVGALEALSEAGRPVDPVALAGAKSLAASDEIGRQREAFYDVSSVLVPLSRLYAGALKGPFQSTYCPMAFDDWGAHWLERVGPIRNPYWGAEMLMCGAVEATVPDEPEP